jgi:hypothetical protein
MIGYPEFSTHYDEDELPPGQELIETTSVKQFLLLAEMIMSSKEKTGYSTMGVVTGLPGVGKTIATRALVNGLLGRPLAGLPACVEIKVKPGSTTRQLVEDLLTRPEGEPQTPFEDESHRRHRGSTLENDA